MMNEIADRYGEALFELAEENHTLTSKKEQAESLIQVIEETGDFDLFLRAIKVTKDEKKATVKKIFNDYYDEDMIHLIELLIDRDRTYYLRDILEKFNELANQKLGIVTGVVQSARKLSEKDMNRISQALEKKTGKKVLLRNKVDEKLIAGIKVTIGNTVTDVTVKREIEEMRRALLKGGLA